MAAEMKSNITFSYWWADEEWLGGLFTKTGDESGRAFAGAIFDEFSGEQKEATMPSGTIRIELDEDTRDAIADLGYEQRWRDSIRRGDAERDRRMAADEENEALSYDIGFIRDRTSDGEPVEIDWGDDGRVHRVALAGRVDAELEAELSEIKDCFTGEHGLCDEFGESIPFSVEGLRQALAHNFKATEKLRGDVERSRGVLNAIGKLIK